MIAKIKTLLFHAVLYPLDRLGLLKVILYILGYEDPGDVAGKERGGEPHPVSVKLSACSLVESLDELRHLCSGGEKNFVMVLPEAGNIRVSRVLSYSPPERVWRVTSWSDFVDETYTDDTFTDSDIIKALSQRNLYLYEI